jgi:quercetin dioxygenase-like cupin family protein
LEGAFTIEVEGEPAVTLKPGEIINLAPKQVHEGKNLLNSPTKVLVFGLAPKGEPLVVPVK